MLLNTGEEVIPSKSGLLTTVAYRIGDEHPVYALEGSIAVTGSLDPVAAGQPRSDQRLPMMSRRWPERWRTTAMSISCRPSAGSSRPTGGPTPGV